MKYNPLTRKYAKHVCINHQIQLASKGFSFLLENAIGIKKLYDVSSERANHRLIDALIMSNDPGKWQALVDALTERGKCLYPKS